MSEMRDVLRRSLDQMSDSFRRDVFKSHDRVNGYAKFQKHSYDHFMTTLLPHIIGEYSRPAIVHDSVSTGRRHVISFGNVTMGCPSHREADGKVCSLLPEEARLRQLDYTLLVMIDATHEVFPLDPDTPRSPEDDEISPEWTMHLPNMEKRVVHREIPFFEMPVMVQSRFCALHGISRVPGRGWDGSGLKQPSSECPRDEGGYFIVKGIDRTLQMQESLRTNTAFVFPVKQPNKHGFVCEVRSRYEAKMRSTSTLRVNITTRKGGTPPSVVIAVPFLPTEVPLLAMFRMLGCARGDMVGFIHGPEPLPASATPHVNAVLRHACEDWSDNEIFDTIGHAGSRDATTDGRRKYVTHILANEFLPHLGLTNTPVEMRKKAMYLGMMVRRLLVAYLDAPPGFSGNEVEGLSIAGVDDRDHIANKRLKTAGTMIALLLRQHMRKFIKTMKRTLGNLIENRRPLDVGNVVNTHKISADIRYAFRTGNWNVQRATTTQNVGITQTVNRMSQLALKSQIGRINTPMNRDGKITHPRQAHISTWGILCPNETPEGVGCGLVKTLAVLTHVRVGSCKSTLETCLFTFMGVQPITPSASNGYIVLVNGDIVGTHPDPTALATRARAARRNHIIPYDTSVVRTAYGVSISIDAGCCMRPLFVAENLPLLERALADTPPGDELWTLLLHRGIIEYLDKEEEMEMRVAVTPAEMRAELDIVDDPQPYTHLEISPSAMLGHCARQIPFADRNQAPRNIYQASMGKQAVAVPTLPFNDRFDAQMHVPHYPQRPVVETGAEDAEFGMGINAVVAIMQYTGYNQEDSIIMNKSFVERGGFRSTYYTTHTSEEQSTGADPECFENPTTCDGDVTGIKQADYSALDEVGTIDLNARLTPGTVLVGKTISTQHIEGKSERNVKRDASLVYNGADDASRVDKVMLTNNRDGVNCQRVRVRSTRIPIVGDKLSRYDVIGWKRVFRSNTHTAATVRRARSGCCCRRRTCRSAWRRASVRTLSSTRARCRRA
jgi:DNA-directed RNA polymerase II subunit RPB2